ncbi:MAG: 16S rRNA (guanine(527)-N(7))-methyltransferase RsmG [Pseudomonadota bacterium]
MIALEIEMNKLFRHFGFQLSKNQISMFAKFHDILLQENKKINITRLHRFEDIVIKHFVDSIIINRHVWLPNNLMDIGTGGGFPGIPLKIVTPKLNLTLVEPVLKRVNFLKLVRKELNLNKVNIIGKKVDLDFSYPAEGIVTRAFKSIDHTLNIVSRSLQVGGRVFFMKGPKADVDLASITNETKKIFSIASDVSYELPNTSYKRRIIVFQKEWE